MLSYRDILSQIVRVAFGDKIHREIHARLWVSRLRKVNHFRDILIQYLHEGDYCMDIGAHGGSWTYPMSKHVGPKGRVFAFEAYPYYTMVLKRTLELLRVTNVELNNIALYNEDGWTNLVTHDRQEKRLTGQTHIQAKHEFNAGKTVKVKTARLDTLLTEHRSLIEIKFIKCDIEGAELFVFEGAMQLLSQVRPVIFCEVVPGYCQRYGHDDRAVFDLLTGLGYTYYQMTGIDYLFVPRM